MNLNRLKLCLYDMKYRERMTSSLMKWRAAVTTVKQGIETKKRQINPFNHLKVLTR